LNAVDRVDAVFGHGRFVWFLHTDVALVFLDPGLDATAGLPDVDVTAPAGHAACTSRPESQATLHALLSYWLPGPGPILIPHSRISNGFLARVLLIALMMEAVQTSETSVNSYQSTRRYNQKDGYFHTHRCEDFEF
jgi:hypothetical protein